MRELVVARFRMLFVVGTKEIRLMTKGERANKERSKTNMESKRVSKRITMKKLKKSLPILSTALPLSANITLVPRCPQTFMVILEKLARFKQCVTP